MIIPPSKIKKQPFEKRLAYGKIRENLVLSKVRKLVDKEAYIINELDKGKDIVCPQKNIKFEVKDQAEAVVAVTVELAKRKNEDSPVRLSGLSTTKSDYYIWHCHKKLFVIKTDKLKELTKDIKSSWYKNNGEEHLYKILYINNLEKNSYRIWSE